MPDRRELTPLPVQSHLYLDDQEVGPYLDATAEYAKLLPLMKARIAACVDFEKVEPSEFRRRTIREALAESGYDHNRLIETLYDSDGFECRRESFTATVQAHVAALRKMILRKTDGYAIAVAAVLLAVSLGLPPDTAFPGYDPNGPAHSFA